MKKFGRLLTAMVTPFDTKGNVDYAQAKKLAKALLASGSDGLVVSGTTGESPTLTTEEKLRLFSEIKAAVPNKATIVAGTGNYNTQESIELTGKLRRQAWTPACLQCPITTSLTRKGCMSTSRPLPRAQNCPA